MDLQEAIKKLQNDDSLRKSFTENPTGVLKNLGVDVSKVKIGKFTEKKSDDTDLLKASACVSIGCVVCASVGI